MCDTRCVSYVYTYMQTFPHIFQTYNKFNAYLLDLSSKHQEHMFKFRPVFLTYTLTCSVRWFWESASILTASALTRYLRWLWSRGAFWHVDYHDFDLLIFATFFTKSMYNEAALLHVIHRIHVDSLFTMILEAGQFWRNRFFDTLLTLAFWSRNQFWHVNLMLSFLMRCLRNCFAKPM